eukprot:TRINITY_DN436_c2_g1_i1.p1 TRINITY_DN436_c2_g1~~TRINITY_DN436_c2_g1_i1.p1  ORF type:complete len:747 (+),score=247.62 TRINITY_DN436_c2_g1_i1:125-2242(+)
MATARSFTAGLVIALAAAPSANADGSVISASSATQTEGSNPIRRVVNMLQKMYGKIETEGEKEKELYDKFMCHCKSELAAFGEGKAKFEAMVPALEAQVEQTKADMEKYSSDIDRQRLERGDAESSIQASKIKREQGKEAFAKQNAEFEANIEAMNAAIPVLEKAVGFLQTKTKTMALSSLPKEHLDRIEKAVMNSKAISESDRQLFSSFLAIGTSEEDEENSPDSSSVKVLIEKTRDEEVKAEQELEAEEEEEVNIFMKLLNSKNTEVETLANSISMKLDKVGELKVRLVELKGQLSDAQKALGKDFALVEKLAESCKVKTSDYEVRSKTRAEELVAVQDTIKILNSDDALETFKKNLPATSLLQLESGRDRVRKHVQQIVNRLSGKDRGKSSKVVLDTVLLALSSKGVDFKKVMKMIDDMGALIRQEQKDEDKKKGFCEETFFENQKKVKVLERKIKDLGSTVQEKKDSMNTLTAEIAELSKGIKELDDAVTDATDQRQKENKEYQELVAGDAQAKDLLRMAKKRMNQFYHPDVATLDKIDVTVPGAAPSFFQAEIKVHQQAEKPAPETYGEFKKSEGAGNSIINMLDSIIKELDAEVAEAKHEENNSQKLYEELLADSQEKRAADSQAVVSKEKAKAEAETEKINHATAAKQETAELNDVQMYDMDVHTDCDWMLKNYEVRKEGRMTEQESLTQAKSVLAGA